MAFSPSEFRPFALRSRKTVSHDSQVLTFDLPSKEDVMGMTVASCIMMKFTDADNEAVIRPYTPISRIGDKSGFDILIKKYPGAKMGTHLQELKEGDTIDVKGPFKKIQIASNEYKSIGFLAGGSGITPMYQIIVYLLDDPEDKTKLTLVFANKTPADILLKQELDELAAKHERFTVHYISGKAPADWTGGVGFLNADTIKQYMPAPGAGKVIVCGPPGMMKHVSGDKDTSTKPPGQGELTGLLKELGYTLGDDVFKM